jgi:O-antigen/teichoic acid export membrane protein
VIQTGRYKQQTLFAAVYKTIAILCMFLSLPHALSYLGSERYGVWSTLTIVSSWITLLDLGVANGLRNKVVEALAIKLNIEARKKIGQAYKILGLIIIFAISFFIGVALALNWSEIFNTKTVALVELKSTIQIYSTLVLLNLWLGLSSALQASVNRTEKTALGHAIGCAVFYIFLLLLDKKGVGSLVTIAIIFGLSSLSGNIYVTLDFFTNNPGLTPIFEYGFGGSRSLLGLSVRFFIVQIAWLVLFATDKMIITQIYTPSEVVYYDIAFRLFGLVTIIQAIASAPLLAIYAEAYQNKRVEIIEKTFKHQFFLFILLVILTVTIACCFDMVLYRWVGIVKSYVNEKLKYSMVAFILISCWNTVFSTFINATGKLNLMIVSGVSAAILNIPLALIFVNGTNLGVAAVPLGTACSLMIGAIIGPVVSKKIFDEVRNQYPRS